MSHEDLLAAILRLPKEDRRRLICDVIKSWRGLEPGDEVEPELRAEWRRQHNETLDRMLIKVL
jgi:hypothetical protein